MPVAVHVTDDHWFIVYGIALSSRYDALQGVECVWRRHVLSGPKLRELGFILRLYIYSIIL